MRRVALALVLAVVALAVATASGAEPPRTSVRVPAGPVLAGDGVLWAESVGATMSVRLASRGRSPRVVHRLDATGFVHVAASPRHVGSATISQSCGDGAPCVASEDVLAGPPGGPLRRVAPLVSCRAQNPWGEAAVDVDGDLAVYVASRCLPGRFLVFHLANRTRPILARRGRFCCGPARLAGHFLAQPAPWGVALVVYDVRNGKPAYRVPIRERERATRVGFDVQRDGKLAIASAGKVFWASPRSPRLHLLAAGARGDDVRIARDRIVFERWIDGRSGAYELGAVDLSGRLRTIATFTPPDYRRTGDWAFASDFDFDGERVTWASDRITDARRECVGDPRHPHCFRVETGVTTIWAGRLGSRPVPVARLPFRDRRMAE